MKGHQRLVVPPEQYVPGQQGHRPKARAEDAATAMVQAPCFSFQTQCRFSKHQRPQRESFWASNLLVDTMDRTQPLAAEISTFSASANCTNLDPRATARSIYEKHGATEFLSTSAPDVDGLDHLTVTIGPAKKQIRPDGPTSGWSFWTEADPADTCANRRHGDFCLEFRR